MPSISALFLDLSSALKDGGDGSGDDTHAIVGFGGISIEVDAGHGKSLARGSLAISKDRTVKAFYEAGEERAGRGSEEGMLCSLWTVYLVEGKDLLFGIGGRGCLGRWRNSTLGGVCGGIYSDLGGRGGVNDGALKTSGNRYRVLARSRSDTQSYGAEGSRE